nr:putative receptor protein kinase ZmPK1 [Tanacetum cinerariifolium]
ENGSLAKNLGANQLDWRKSYGMVALEMITGRSPTSDDNQSEEGFRWTEVQIMNILDPMNRDETEKDLVKHLLKVALQCVEEDKDARPSMSEVVNMLLSPDSDYERLAFRRTST